MAIIFQKTKSTCKNAINSNLNYWTGKSKLQFENKFAKFMGIKYGIAMFLMHQMA